MYSKFYDAYHGISHPTNYHGCILYKERMVTIFYLVLCAYIQFCLGQKVLFALLLEVEGATCHITTYGWKQRVTTVNDFES